MAKKVGLTLAKFAPMHVGHKALINECLEVVDELYVLLYDCPDITTIPLERRAFWVKQTFATNRVKVLQGYNAPNRHGDTPEVKQLQDNYLKTVFKGVPLTHFLSSEYYGEHVSRALGLQNVVLDPEREKHGMSATMIRNDTGSYRAKVSPLVYCDMLYKVGVLGSAELSAEIVKNLATHYSTLGLVDADYDIANLSPNASYAKAGSGDKKELIYEADHYLFASADAIDLEEIKLRARWPKFGHLASVAKSFDLLFLIEDSIGMPDWELAELTAYLESCNVATKVISSKDAFEQVKRYLDNSETSKFLQH